MLRLRGSARCGRTPLELEPPVRPPAKTPRLYPFTAATAPQGVRGPLWGAVRCPHRCAGGPMTCQFSNPIFISVASEMKIGERQVRHLTCWRTLRSLLYSAC